jgi:hypothetical protein
VIKEFMTVYHWRKFLTQWSEQVFASQELARAMPVEVRTSRWLGYRGAAEAQLASTEMRLRATLPPSYREFLRVTDGWGLISSHFVGRLWPTKKVEWLTVSRPKWFNNEMGWEAVSVFIPDQEYFVYGEEQDPALTMRFEYLASALEISDIDDGKIFLLNPQIITSEGEWEAWYFSNWLPGAMRYRSFWELMQAEYQSFSKSEKIYS